MYYILLYILYKHYYMYKCICIYFIYVYIFIYRYKIDNICGFATHMISGKQQVQIFLIFHQLL